MPKERNITVALAGNANVGKSVIFNHLTGLHQHVGNYPGKTVERKEGTLHFKGYTIDVFDLPGIYSLSTFSMEELVSREYIAAGCPDVVINVVDASVLERNLFFTIQLVELEAPVIIDLNQIDMAKNRGIIVDHEKLHKILGIPVIPTVATKSLGIDNLLDTTISVAVKKKKIKPARILYGPEIEERIQKLTSLTKNIDTKYPSRWVAIKLLEGDSEVTRMISQLDSVIINRAELLAGEIEHIHGEQCSTVIAAERYVIANKLAEASQHFEAPSKVAIAERLDTVTLHKIFGYPIMLALMLSIFLGIFTFGDLFSGFLNSLFESAAMIYVAAFGIGLIPDLLWGGPIEGLISGTTVALPYILPFYIVLTILEDSGYLTRVAFLMDVILHKMGLHGKAFIPLLLGFGCNVPACLSCRIMETHRERLIAIFVTTLVPCAATSVIILGVVGKFVGIEWALMLYGFNLLIIFLLGNLAFKVLPGEPMGLIMEMPPYRLPSLNVVAKKTWLRLKDFIFIAFPLIIVGSFIIKILEVFDLLDPIGVAMSPVTVGWLGLPAVTGILLIFGVLRKELTVIMLATLLGTTNFAAVLTPVQMLVFALVAMLYIPCIATIAALVREIGWKRALYITLFEIMFAIAIGGIAFRLFTLG